MYEIRLIDTLIGLASGILCGISLVLFICGQVIKTVRNADYARGYTEGWTDANEHKRAR